MIGPDAAEIVWIAGGMLVFAVHVYVVAYLARWKGRSILGWLLLTHWFPILGFIILVLATPLPGSRAAQQSAAREARVGAQHHP